MHNSVITIKLMALGEFKGGFADVMVPHLSASIYILNVFLVGIDGF
jgi:hypothetical protein